MVIGSRKTNAMIGKPDFGRDGKGAELGLIHETRIGSVIGSEILHNIYYPHIPTGLAARPFGYGKVVWMLDRSRQ